MRQAKRKRDWCGWWGEAEWIESGAGAITASSNGASEGDCSDPSEARRFIGRGCGTGHLGVIDGFFNGYASAIGIACIINEFAILFFRQTIISRFANVGAGSRYASIGFTPIFDHVVNCGYNDVINKIPVVSTSRLSWNTFAIAAQIASEAVRGFLEVRAINATGQLICRTDIFAASRAHLTFDTEPFGATHEFGIGRRREAIGFVDA